MDKQLAQHGARWSTIFINATENYVRRTIVIYWPAVRPGAKTAIAILHGAMHRTSHALFKIYGARTTGPE